MKTVYGCEDSRSRRDSDRSPVVVGWPNDNVIRHGSFHPTSSCAKFTLIPFQVQLSLGSISEVIKTGTRAIEDRDLSLSIYFLYVEDF